MSNAASVFWNFFLAAVVSLAIVIVAFGAAMVIAQRRRLAMQNDYAQRILRAQEEERAWVARELHDDMLQRVAMIRHELDTLWTTLSSCATPKESHSLRALNAELVDLGVALREVAHRLHPTIVDHLGLPKALEALAGEFQRATHLDIRLALEQREDPLPAPVAHAAYRIAQEALRNAAKHSGSSIAEVELCGPAEQLVLRIRDYGRGFSPRSDERNQGIGIASMRERAGLVHGTVTVTSHPGQGTTIEARLPRNAA